MVGENHIISTKFSGIKCYHHCCHNQNNNNYIDRIKNKNNNGGAYLLYENHFTTLFKLKLSNASELASETAPIKNFSLQKNKNKHKNKIKMPPITEKRSPSILKGSVKENFPSSNTASTIQQNKQQQPLSDKIENRVPEIIDFRDTWLEEIEMYKDQIKAQQQQFLLIQQQQQNNNFHGHQHHHSHHHHNNVHNRVSQAADYNIYGDDELSTMTTISTPTAITFIASQQQNNSGKSFDSVKRRIRARSNSDSYDKCNDETDDGRAREDNNLTPPPPSTLLSSTLSSNKNKNTRNDNATATNNRNSKLTKNRKRKSPSPSSSTTTSSSPSSAESSKMLSGKYQIRQNIQVNIVETTIISSDTNHEKLFNTFQQKVQQQKKSKNHKSTPVSCNSKDSGICSLSPQSHSGLNNCYESETISAATATVANSKPLQESSKVNRFSSVIEPENSAAAPAAPAAAATTTTTTEKCLENYEINKTPPELSSNQPLVTNSSESIAKDDKKSDETPDCMASKENELDDEDDEFFGDIDETNIYESSDNEDDDEYVGYAYYLNLEEDCEKSFATSNPNNNHYITPNTPLSPSLFPNVPPFINFSSHAEKGPPFPTEIQKILKWKLTNVMPKIVRKVISNSGFRLIKKPIDWMGTWEKHMKSPCFKMIRSHQKFNHLPGTFKIGRKDSVWRNLHALSEKHGKREFGLMPKTYILPQELDDLRKIWPRSVKKNTKWIIKPPASARGTGIKVINKWSQIPKSTPLIVQKYIERPLLIEGNKFDLRLYVIVMSINPLRIFLHTDGLARFASVQYSDKLDTLDDRCMHLTNYSINKLSSNYAKNEDINACQGHKWTLKSLWSYFDQRGINTKRLWATLRNLVIRTVISGENCLNKMFKQNVNSKYSCYELFGFDVLLDENLVPWLLEVNISPSLHSELALDQHVKGPLVQAVLNTALYQIPSKISEQVEKQVLKEYNLNGPLCYDKRIFTACLSPEEVRKHNQFTNRSIEDREDYLYTILDDLTPDDVRCLIIAEDELARSKPLERIFPGPESYMYLKFLEGPRYYNRLLDAWETKYADSRDEGIRMLQELCKKEYHLKVSPATRQNSEERIEKLQNEKQQKDNETNDLTRTDSQLSMTTTLTTNCDCDDDDDDNVNSVTSNISSIGTNSDNQQQSSSAVVSTTSAPTSCSKEAVTKTVIVATDTENQLNSGPRPIAVQIQ